MVWPRPFFIGRPGWCDPAPESSYFHQGQHQRVLGRVQAETDDIFQFYGEIGIVADLETLHVVRLQPMACQMRPTLKSEMPASRAIVLRANRSQHETPPGTFLDCPRTCS